MTIVCYFVWLTIPQGPTIFPMLFAAVAGRSLKTMARFCAERGTKIGVRNFSVLFNDSDADDYAGPRAVVSKSDRLGDL